ncbi:MAG: YkgJ family cysteine cluster protein [Sorangiineae bacterium]|nr:YkgJ family cysteine cluster protein [Polyangiaceae bacterium]MEB2323547.1 YkgJ family cysteine cluster protein [Sorangiineae bacterium]
MITGERLLRFRCTGCGNCCKEPLLPLTDADLRALVRHTGESAHEIVSWVDRFGIDMAGEPEAFVVLRQGRRVMTLAHRRGGCRYLDPADRCTVYSARPMGCRVFPFDPTFSKRDGSLRRLALIPAAECLYELDGENDPARLRELHARHLRAIDAYHARVKEWNLAQRRRRRAGKAAETARAFLAYLGFA